jgi:predicted DNA-binding protein with PD1-like motif
MRWSEGKRGRVFVLRLEDGEVLHEVVEEFARERGIMAATVLAVGGADKGSELVVGPEDGRAGLPQYGHTPPTRAASSDGVGIP